MPDDTKRRGLTDEQRDEAKRRYEAGESMASIARALDVRRPTLIAARDRATEQGHPWIVQASVQVSEVEARAVRERATAQVIDIATKRAVERMDRDGTLDHAVNDINEHLRIQGPLYGKAAKLLDATFDKAIAGKLKLAATQGETTAVTDLLNALSKFASDTRKAAGLRDGTPTIASENEDDRRVDQSVLVVDYGEKSA